MAMAFIVMPGADFALITKVTLGNGRRAGQITACGIAGGLLVHTTAAVLGLSAIISQSALLFDIVKYIGAAYLFYLGVTAFRDNSGPEVSNNEVAESVQTGSTHLWNFFCQGILANVLNPKTVIFYLTFLPQFVNQSQPVMFQLIILGVILFVLSLAWFVFLAYALGFIRKYFDNPVIKSRMQKVTGVLLISFGLKLALDKG
jgi:RhtB (resistance to homoserine/threonine) family protein